MTTESLIQRQHTTTQTRLAAVLVGVVGVTLIAVSASLMTGWPIRQSIVRELGALLFASVAVTLLWELAVKRSFVAELMATANLADDIREFGIVKVTGNFQRGLDWATLLGGTSKLDVFFAYGRTWRGTNTPELRAIARRTAEVRIILPDPDVPEVLGELARRFSSTAEDMKKKIEEATGEFKNIFVDDADVKAKFNLWYSTHTPQLTFYRFDKLAVIALYKHKPGRGDVPAVLAREGGELFRFISEEFAHLTSANSRKILSKET